VLPSPLFGKLSSFVLRCLPLAIHVSAALASAMLALFPTAIVIPPIPPLTRVQASFAPFYLVSISAFSSIQGQNGSGAIANEPGHQDKTRDVMLQQEQEEQQQEQQQQEQQQQEQHQHQQQQQQQQQHEHEQQREQHHEAEHEALQQHNSGPQLETDYAGQLALETAQLPHVVLPDALPSELSSVPPVLVNLLLRKKQLEVIEIISHRTIIIIMLLLYFSSSRFECQLSCRPQNILQKMIFVLESTAAAEDSSSSRQHSTANMGSKKRDLFHLSLLRKVTHG
jgi:flagellar motor protein MotB